MHSFFHSSCSRHVVCSLCGFGEHSETPKIGQVNDILGGPDPTEDDGWADVVEKKSVVATGGKQVSELM